MSKQINCQFISPENEDNAAIFLNNYPKEKLNNLLWSENGYFPEVSFSMAYTSSSILLKYWVTENYAEARHTQVNDLVYKDSCVEFFISFDNGANYYNLEFNCIGTPYAAYGAGNPGRVTLPADVIEQFKIFVKTESFENENLTKWELILDIPFSAFIYNDIKSLKGVVCKGNFYKCGDETTVPHYLSWNNIVNPVPNFHLPEFFGTISFI